MHLKCCAQLKRGLVPVTGPSVPLTGPSVPLTGPQFPLWGPFSLSSCRSSVPFGARSQKLTSPSQILRSQSLQSEQSEHFGFRCFAARCFESNMLPGTRAANRSQKLTQIARIDFGSFIFAKIDFGMLIFGIWSNPSNPGMFHPNSHSCNK